MIDTRIPALVAGASALVFGAWAALGDIPEMGLAAGMLGMLAGVSALSHRPNAGPREAAAPEMLRTSQAETPDELIQPEVQALVRTDYEPGHLEDHTSDEVADLRSAIVPDTHDPPATSLTDPATGLFSEDYLRVALESRLASARRHLRPVAIALVDVSAGLPGDNSRPADPNIVAEAFRNTVRDSDIACRLNDGTFGVILEDTPENGAVWTVERVRRNLVSSSGHHTLWAGVACYPAHAFDCEDLMEQVRYALTAAREWNQDRIEVAIAE